MHTQWKLNERDVYEARMDHGADESGPLFMQFWIAPITTSGGRVQYQISYKFSDDEQTFTLTADEPVVDPSFRHATTFLEAASRCMECGPRWMDEHFFRA